MEALSVLMYHVLKPVQGNFNEGNVALFGDAAGRQCARNALFLVCWLVVRKVSIWKSYDLGNILIEGDKMILSQDCNKIQQASLKRQPSYTGTQIKDRKLQKYLHEKNKKHSFGNKMVLFKKLVYEGRYYICVVCKRCIYRRSVILYSEEKVPLLDENSLNLVVFYDGYFYICKTCSREIKKGHTPCEPVCDRLEIYEFPQDPKNIRRLEKVLIAIRILFKKLQCFE